MNQEFKRAMARLNAEQKKAVEQVQGPLLVIAGPGTGKTELLSARVANILKSTDAKPSNILCLTFTNKATVNMKERIIGLTGPEGARVVVKTFHSFGGEIMSLYPDNFWNAAALSVAPESVQLDIIESIVKNLPLDNPLALKFAGQYTLLNEVQRSINLAKEAGMTPDKLRTIIAGNIAYIELIEDQLVEILSASLSAKKLGSLKYAINSLPKMEVDSRIYPLLSLSTVIQDSLAEAIAQDEGSGKAANTSRWKRRWLQNIGGQKGMFDERRRNDWWLKLADVYEQYRDAIHQRGFYDYADMLVEVISQLEQNPAMRADVQERFGYILIDEFQDTNPAQLRLAHLVSDHPSLNGKPNLMVVGDDDQSIFKFNGAELNNMLGFRRAYPAAKTIVLSKNYRSSQEILDVAKKIIEQAQVRLVKADKSLSKDLTAENPPAGKTEVKALSYSSRELQISQIARDIQKNYTPGCGIAVLARNHDSLVRMSGVLQQLGVPVRYEQAANILDHEIVDQTYKLAGLLIAIRQGDKDEANTLIHQIIRHPMWGIEPYQLWQLANHNRGEGNWLESLLASSSKDIRTIGEWFIWLAQQADSQPLAVSLEQILGLRPSKNFTSPIKDYFTGAGDRGSNNYFHSLSAIQLLRALVHEFAKSGQPSLDELVRFVELNRDNSKIIADESPFITGEHAVQLLTVHKAKGLEFDHVYIIDAIDDNWRPRAGGRKPPANLPLQPVGDDLDDYIRLMYVAVTRARSVVTISAYYQDHAGKDVAPSPIIQSALPFKKETERDPKKLITVLEQNLHWPELGAGQEKQMLKARLETYNLSVTGLINFLDLTRGGPQYFKERNLLRLPEAKTPSLAYGTAIHDALYAAQKMTNRGRFSLKEVVTEFDKSLAAQQLAVAEHSRFRAQGHRTLKRLLQDFAYVLPKGSIAEQKMSDLRLGRAVISGKLDRLDTADGKLRIIDYKTGSALRNFNTKDKKGALKAYKHKLQLVFYALLAGRHSSYSRYKAIEGQMVYVDSEDQKQLELTYTPSREDIEHLERLIEAVWPRIINLELPDVSAYSKDIDGIRAFEEDLLA